MAFGNMLVWVSYRFWELFHGGTNGSAGISFFIKVVSKSVPKYSGNTTLKKCLNH
jgi:hypothetical protein